jgi:hypothetical protein
MLAHSVRHLQFVEPKPTYELLNPMFNDKFFTGTDGSDGVTPSIQHYGTKECVPFRDKIIPKYPELSSAICAEYDHIASTSSYANANRRLVELDKRLSIKRFHLTDESLISTNGFHLSKANLFSIDGLNLTGYDDDILDLAIKIAYSVKQYKTRKTDEETLTFCIELAEHYRLDFSSLIARVKALPALLNRFLDPSVWKRKLSALCRSELQAVTRELRQVHKFFSPYSSHFCAKRYKSRKAKTEEYLANTVLENELGYSLTLLDAASRNPSNPYIRFVELVRVSEGYSEIASQIGYECLFITLTAPSCKHKMQLKYERKGHHKKAISAIPNPSFDGSSPKEVNRYLAHLYELITAKLARNNIHKFGIRSVEPHHDGTPHWHFCLFLHPKDIEQTKDIFREYALKDYPNEKGASKQRVKFEVIPSGAATGYLIKYITKNTTGTALNNSLEKDIGTEWYGTDPLDNVLKIESWARDCGIRQFQVIGVHSVQAYREFRRLEEQTGHLESIRQAAQDGDWASFVNLMGGPFATLKDIEIRLAYGARQKLDKETGEVIEQTTSKYGDDAKDTVIGLIHAGVTILTRIHFWEVKSTSEVVQACQKIMDGVVDLIEEVNFQNARIIPHHRSSKPHSDENLFSKSGVLPAWQRAPLRQTKSGALDLFQ